MAGANVVYQSAGWLESGLVACFEKFAARHRAAAAPAPPVHARRRSTRTRSPSRPTPRSARAATSSAPSTRSSASASASGDPPWRRPRTSSAGAERLARRPRRAPARSGAQALERYEQPPLDDAMRAELSEFVARRTRELGDEPFPLPGAAILAGSRMKLEGIHHITAITGDAPRNVDFYAGVLGLRMVKKTVNQDDPSVYHLFYADEHGSARRRPDVLRVPRRGARAGRARGWCTASSGGSPRAEALDFWAERLGGEGVATRARGRRPRCSPTPRAWRTSSSSSTARRAADRAPPRDPGRARAAGLRGACAPPACGPTRAPRCSRRRSSSTPHGRRRWEARGDERGGRYALRPAARRARRARAPARVHHIAWASTIEDHEAWGERRARARPAPDARDRPLLLPLDLLPRARRRALRDRDARARASRSTSRSSSLGEHLSLPPDFEHLRERIEPVLTPLPGHPRVAARDRRERRRGVRPPLRARHAARRRCCCCTAPAATSTS